jgi:hypothetical protein
MQRRWVWIGFVAVGATVAFALAPVVFGPLASAGAGTGTGSDVIVQNAADNPVIVHGVATAVVLDQDVSVPSGTASSILVHVGAFRSVRVNFVCQGPCPSNEAFDVSSRSPGGAPWTALLDNQTLRGTSYTAVYDLPGTLLDVGFNTVSATATLNGHLTVFGRAD